MYTEVYDGGLATVDGMGMITTFGVGGVEVKDGKAGAGGVSSIVGAVFGTCATSWLRC